MFLVLNTSGLTIIPVSVIALRSSMDPPAANATDVFLPILIATYAASLVGLIVVSTVQRVNLLQPVVLLYLLVMTSVIAGMGAYFYHLDSGKMESQSLALGGLIIFAFIFFFVALAAIRKVPVYEKFIEGAKDGFSTAVTIIPYLVAMLIAVGIFRACGALDEIINAIKALVAPLGGDTRWVDGMPTATMKPLSGSGARAMAVEAMETYGVDSFRGKLSCVMQGSTETTFYTLAVYFGVVKIRKTRHALPCGLAADVAGIIAAIVVAYAFFGHLK